MDGFPTTRVPSDESAPLRLEELMRELASKASALRFQVAPNPCVGAAILSREVEIGRGFHTRWGGPHAEVHALAAATTGGIEPSAWDTLVVTLEPCSSVGKTPACVDAILETSIERVVVGAVDPDPRHKGEGLERLRAAGLNVELLPVAPLHEVAPHFLRWVDVDRVRRPRPWAIAKWAQTRTGQLTPPENVGDGRWISGPESRVDVHRLRGGCDAIVTGIGTVRADNPRLTVRAPAQARRVPLRCVLDSELMLSTDARLFETEREEGEVGGDVVVFCRAGASPARHRALTARGAEVIPVRLGDDGRLSLRDVAALLWDRGVRRMLLEAGPTLLDAWFQAHLGDQLAVYTGDVNGGRGPSLATWLESRRLEGSMWREIGSDSVLEAFVRPA